MYLKIRAVLKIQVHQVVATGNWQQFDYRPPIGPWESRQIMGVY